MQRGRLLKYLAFQLPQSNSAVTITESLCQGSSQTNLLRRVTEIDQLQARTLKTQAPSESTALEVSTDGGGVVFPREGPGVSYALNWALAAAGVTPSGEAFRNLKPSALEKKGASPAAAKKGTPLYIKEGASPGAESISKVQFNRLFKEVTAHLSGTPSLFVHDGAIGSAPDADARTRTISDSPAGALAFGEILNRTPTRSVSASSFPVAVYVATGYSSASFPGEGFIALDYDSSSVIVGGTAVGDKSAIKTALAAVANPIISQTESSTLPAWVVKSGNSSALLLVPSSASKSLGFISKSALFSDAGAIWSSKGIARFFQADSSSPNVYAAPSAFVLVTSDSTGAIPEISKLTPAQAAYYFLLGYDGVNFNPAYSSGPSGLKPLETAQKLSSLLSTSGVPAFLVNASSSSGEPITEKELTSLVAAAVSEKLPKSKAKKPSESAAKALALKFEEYAKTAFGELPENVRP